MNVATNIEYPNVKEPWLAEVEHTERPLTIKRPDFEERWELTLQEAVLTGLQSSKTIRSLGMFRQTQPVGQSAGTPVESLTNNPEIPHTVYDPAIQETGDTGVEAALAEFDAQLRTAFTYDHTDRPQNVTTFAPTLLRRNLANWETALTKRAATGSQLALRTNVRYDATSQFFQGLSVPAPARPFEFDWLSWVETEVRQPLLRNAGVEVNRIPVILARINTDISLTDLEIAVRNYVLEIERAYWDLYFHYRNLDAAKTGRNSAHATWKRSISLGQAGLTGGGASDEANARDQYFLFRGRVETALSNLYDAENHLRYLMGIAATDGRLIQPVDQPTSARVEFDWLAIRNEALIRSPETRRMKWRVKQQELQLAASRNRLLPQLDVVALYRLLDFKVAGDFQEPPSISGFQFPITDRGELDNFLSDGRHQEWRLGFEFSTPIGVRAELADLRSRQLELQRARARLQDLELEITHQLTSAIRRLEDQHQIAQTALNRVIAATDRVKAEQEANVGGLSSSSLDLLLDAQRRQAEAEVEYHRALTQYNLAIVEVHFRKGSLLEYDGIAMAEGPSPRKAYQDAQELARSQMAGSYLDHYVSRPRAVSCGPIQSLDSPDSVSSAPADAKGFDGIAPQPASLPPEPPETLVLPQVDGALNQSEERQVARTSWEEKLHAGRGATTPAASGAIRRLPPISE